MSSAHNEHDVAPPQPGHGEAVSHIEPDDIGVGLLSVLGTFVAVVVLLIAVLLQAWFYNWKVEFSARQSGPLDPQLTPATIAEKQLDRINTYGWVDRKAHIRAIPIDRAMELVAAELGGMPSREAGDMPSREAGGMPSREAGRHAEPAAPEKLDKERGEK